LEKQERSKAAQTASREKAWRGRTEVKLKQKKTLEDAFSVFDADGSGKLEKAEMKEILTRANSSGGEMTDADAEEFISLFDKDGDGKIDIKEFIEVMKALQGSYVESTEHGDDEMIQDDLEDVDTDSDGKLDYTEFCAFEKRRVELLGETITDDELSARFLEMDKDGSGSIDLKELIHRRVEDVERAYKEDAAEMAENLVEGGLGIIKSGEVTANLVNHAHKSGLDHGELMK